MKKIIYTLALGTLLSASPSAAAILARKQFEAAGKPVSITYETNDHGCTVTADIEVYKAGSRGLLCEPEETYRCERTIDRNGVFQPKACEGIPPQSVLEQLVQKVY